MKLFDAIHKTVALLVICFVLLMFSKILCQGILDKIWISEESTTACFKGSPSVFCFFHEGGSYCIETNSLIFRAEPKYWFLYVRDHRHE